MVGLSGIAFDVLGLEGEHSYVSVTIRTVAYAAGTANDGSSQRLPVDFRA
jgi:hypothetical protein